MWHTPVPDSHPAARLLTASAVRERCAAIMSAAERGDTRHLAWRPDRLAAAAAYVADTIRLRFPNLDVPYHSRWRHFEAGGIDRWGPIAANLRDDSTERARTRIDLAITSVLMDAGAGPAWRYADGQTGSTLARSEGLGVASLRLFASGAFSAHLLMRSASFLDSGVVFTRETKQASWLMSDPMKFRPLAIASTALVPPPMNGSSTVSPGFVNRPIASRANSGEKRAG